MPTLHGANPMGEGSTLDGWTSRKAWPSYTHLGGSVASEIMWSLAHEQGITLPAKDYWAFDSLVATCPTRAACRISTPSTRSIAGQS